MRLTLVQPPNGFYDPGDLAPPLGLLTIAAVVEEDNVDVTIVDMNLKAIRDHHWVQNDFYGKAIQAIAETNPDVVGFTSMVIESHICLELARRFKMLDSSVVTIMGGPHFSAIAKQILELYPWVDYVVTGEGELATRALLKFLRKKAKATALINVARRVKDHVVLERGPKPWNNLDKLPFPAYHLVDLQPYFETNPLRMLNYEQGRGCAFRCSFCYSSKHWGQGEQVKQADQVVKDVAHLNKLGARHLFFVQDNFPKSKNRAKMICRALADAQISITWNCYATLPQLTPDFLDDLAEAGCNSVFVGIDAISKNSQHHFQKHFYKGWSKLKEQLQNCLDRGIIPTCAFMIDTPAQSHNNTDVALTTALFARAMGCGIRLNTLTLYNQTTSEITTSDQSRIYTDQKPRLLLDTPAIAHDNPYARKHPELFPFHNTILPLPLYKDFVIGMHIAFTLYKSFPRTLRQYILSDNGSLWKLMQHLAHQLGHITEVHARMRRPIERELFLREFPHFSLSEGTRNALTLEETELRFGRNEPAQIVSVKIGSKIKVYQKGCYRILELNYHPAVFDQDKAVPTAKFLPQSYLLVRQHNRIHYFEVPKKLVAIFNQINSASFSKEIITMNPNLLMELLKTQVLVGPISIET